MRPRTIMGVSAAAASLVLTIMGFHRADALGAQSAAPNALAGFTRTWRDNSIWHDGRAEVAVYDATRSIYGVKRQYKARLYTNKEHASAETKTKDPSGKGRAVFKHHLREDIPTENYTYHFSTMCYVGVDDLKSLKIDMGSQEDCGASFKQFVNHDGAVTWNSFTYFPDEGHTSGSYEPPHGFVFQDALSLILRGYPFDDPPELPMLMMLPDQTDTHRTDTAPRSVSVRYLGRKFVHLPIGRVDSQHLQVTGKGLKGPHDYWFDFDVTAPRLNVMVQYEGPGGISYKLRKHGRSAYWKR